MSTNPIAILYYGIQLDSGEDGELFPEEFDEEANDAWEDMHRPKEPEDKGNYRTPEWDEWRARLKAYKATPEHVEVSWSGSGENMAYFVHCPCLQKRVEWDEQIDIGHSLPFVPPEATDWIRKFCEAVGLPFKQPTWHLAARYF